MKGELKYENKENITYILYFNDRNIYTHIM